MGFPSRNIGYLRTSVCDFSCTAQRNQKAPSERELSRKRLRESACTRRFDGSAVKRSKTLFSQSPPPLRGAPSRREPWERSPPREKMQNWQRSRVRLLTTQERYPNRVGALHEAPEISVTSAHPSALFFAQHKETKRLLPRGSCRASD